MAPPVHMLGGQSNLKKRPEAPPSLNDASDFPVPPFPNPPDNLPGKGGFLLKEKRSCRDRPG
jgi:hypothetical protein